MVKKNLIVLGVVSLVLVGVYLIFRPVNSTVSLSKNSESEFYKSQTSVFIGGMTIKIEIADTEALREKGLSGHRPLKENEGMLFVFEKPDIYSFWMKDMLFPIDILWLDSEKEIVYIKKDAQPLSYPEAFSSNLPAFYVLELSSGFSDRYNLKIGDKVSF